MLIKCLVRLYNVGSRKVGELELVSAPRGLVRGVMLGRRGALLDLGREGSRNGLLGLGHPVPKGSARDAALGLLREHLRVVVVQQHL